MAIGTLAWNLAMPHGKVTEGLVATRKELRAAAAVTREMSQPTEMYGTAVDNLNQLLNKNLLSVENYRRKMDELKQELRESDPEWQRQNALQQRAAEVKSGLMSAEQRALGPMREARELRKAGLLTDQQYHDRLSQIKSTLPTVVAAEKRLADERKRAEQITRQNLTAEERYKQSVRELPAALLTTKTGVETYRREVVRLRNEYLSTLPAQRSFMAGLMGSVARIGGPLAALTGVSVGIGSLGMAARSGLRNYNEFATGMARSTSIMGDLSEDQLRRMRDTARDVSFDVQASAAQATEAYYFLASAGLDAESSIASMPLVAKFAQAGTFDLALATDLLTDAQSALGLNIGTTAEKLDGMANIADVLTLAAIKSNASIEQFSTSLTTKAGTALKSYNKDLEEGVAVLSVFADQGIKDEVAGTALAIVLRDLSTQALTNEDAFRRHGVAVFDDAEKMRHTGEIVRDLENKLQGLSDKAKKEILLELGFTDKSMGFTQALIGNSERILQLDADYRQAQGTLDDVAGKTMSGMTTAVNTLKAGWDEFAGIVIPALGEGFMSVEGRPLEETIREINAGVKEMGPLLIDIGKSWGEVAQFVGDTASAMRPLMDSWNSINESMGEFSDFKLNDLFKPSASNLAPLRDNITWLTLKSREWAGLADEGAAEHYFAMQQVAGATADAAQRQTDLAAGANAAGDAMQTAAERAQAMEAILADDPAHEQLAEKLDTFKTKLQEEIDLFGLTGHAAELARLRKLGAGEDEIAEHQRLIEAIEAKAEAAREAAEQEREYARQTAEDQRAAQAEIDRVQQALDSLKTPEMEFDERIAELAGWLATGAITLDQNAELVARAYDEMTAKIGRDKEEIEKPVKLSVDSQGIEAIEAGSAEHLQKIADLRDRQRAERTDGETVVAAERSSRPFNPAAASPGSGPGGPSDATNRDIVMAIREANRNRPDPPTVALGPANFGR